MNVGAGSAGAAVWKRRRSAASFFWMVRSVYFMFEKLINEDNDVDDGDDDDGDPPSTPHTLILLN
jgi:hypothetical protein